MHMYLMCRGFLTSLRTASEHRTQYPRDDASTDGLHTEGGPGAADRSGIATYSPHHRRIEIASKQTFSRTRQSRPFAGTGSFARRTAQRLNIPMPDSDELRPLRLATCRSWPVQTLQLHKTFPPFHRRDYRRWEPLSFERRRPKHTLPSRTIHFAIKSACSC